MIAALFVRADSIYKTLPGVDCYDMERDARGYTGSNPVVAHPPCRGWGCLRHMAKPRPDEKELALFAVDTVRRCGGVLEHPEFSSLWDAACLPFPGKVDAFGGWTLPVPQFWFGHRARKNTWMYIVGVSPDKVPSIPLRLGEATHVISTSKRVDGRLTKPECSKAEREKTPPPLAQWLVEVARRCRK